MGSLAFLLIEGYLHRPPPLRGPKTKIPEAVTKALATHAAMSQLSGDGEASKSKLLVMSQGLTLGTKHEGTFLCVRLASGTPI